MQAAAGWAVQVRVRIHVGTECRTSDAHSCECCSIMPSASTPCHTGHKQWVGVNDWQGLPPVNVALGVRSGELTEWVLDRMTR